MILTDEEFQGIQSVFCKYLQLSYYRTSNSKYSWEMINSEINIMALFESKCSDTIKIKHDIRRDRKNKQTNDVINKSALNLAFWSGGKGEE